MFGKILVGLVLGPTVLNVLGWPLFAAPAAAGVGDSTALLPALRDLAEIGVVLLMFVAGLETDVAEIRRVGKVVFWSAFGGVVLPMIGGAAVAVAFGSELSVTPRCNIRVAVSPDAPDALKISRKHGLSL